MLAVGTLASLYQNHLEQFPERSILIQDGRALSYSAFDTQVSQTRAWLSTQGVKSGDRIAVWVVNRSEWLVLFFALAQLNATLVAVPGDAGQRLDVHRLAEVRRRAADAEPGEHRHPGHAPDGKP